MEEWIAQLRGAVVDLGAEYASPYGFTVRYPSDWVYVEIGEDQETRDGGSRWSVCQVNREVPRWTSGVFFT